MSANPHANGGLLLSDLRLPDFRDYAVEVAEPGRRDAEADARHGQVPARRDEAEPDASNFRLFSPDENNSNRWQDVLEVTNRAWVAEILPVRRPPGPRRPRDGDAQRAPVPGLARGLSAHRPARLLLAATRPSSTSSTRCSTSTPSG